MNIRVNGEPVILDGTTIADLARQLSLPEQGVAVALKMTMIPRSKWDVVTLAEGDDLMIIKAASGG